MKTLRLFSRSECHLCEVLAADLAPLIGDRARVQVVDIDGDPGLERAYGLRIPVLVGDDGRELSSYPLDTGAVAAYLGLDDG